MWNDEQMGKIGEELDIDFVISTGDNFYEDGLQGVYDNQFQQSFTDIYTANSLQKQWYSGKKNRKIIYMESCFIMVI